MVKTPAAETDPAFLRKAAPVRGLKDMAASAEQAQMVGVSQPDRARLSSVLRL